MKNFVNINIIGFLIVISSLCSCSNVKGYRVCAYVPGDENHTCYEDTILWGYSLDDAEKYFKENVKYDYSIIKYIPVTKLDYPKNTKRVTIDEVKPHIVYRPIINKEYYNTKNDTINKDKHTPSQKTKNERNIRVRTNGSLDVNTGIDDVTYNLRSGKMGMRVSENLVIDMDGIHFDF